MRYYIHYVAQHIVSYIQDTYIDIYITKNMHEYMIYAFRCHVRLSMNYTFSI